MAPDVLCLHISEQNAGIVLRRQETEMALEFFQASPTAAAVTGNRGKLIVQFPSRPRRSVPNDPLFIKSLCMYLEAMDKTPMRSAASTTTKAKVQQVEHREVPDIRYISELLGGISRALTSDVDTMAKSTEYVTKRLNDHVLWKDALNPWRRDPQWLVIRVALQTSISKWKIDERFGYKAFITFVLSQALEKAIRADLGHDQLYAMNVKIATRIYKLKSLVDDHFPFDYITHVGKLCRQHLEHRWRAIKEDEARPLSWTIPTETEIQTAQEFALTTSREYLSAVYNRSNELQRRISIFSSYTFEASLIGIPTIGRNATDANLWLIIVDVEHWICNDLPDWEKGTTSEVRLEELKRMITGYDELAASLENPEQFSRVFLIILELWMALDRTTIELVPLLEEYSPELSVSSFEPLILPTLCQLKRLRTVETYLQRRHDRAKDPYRRYSLFDFINDKDSFAARYFQTDTELPTLRSLIESEAIAMRDDKIRERTVKNETYIRLKDENNLLYHDRVCGLDGCEADCDPNCRKCRVESQLRRMVIKVFEWPLPEEDILSQQVVFELQVPKPVAIWRDISYCLARNYSYEYPNKRPNPTTILSNYGGLQKHLSPNLSSQQITIASIFKPFLKSHYRECRDFPCEVSDVVKPHPLCYAVYDVTNGEWVHKLPNITIRERCTPILPSGPYGSLAWAVDSTIHTSNMVISRQADCPPELSYHEWEALGHIRAGHRLQWRNMMLELVRETVALGEPAVHLLFRQAAFQAEKGSNSDHREAHLDLTDEAFGIEAIGVLRRQLDRIRDTWQEGWTASTLGILACRLFSLSTSVAVRRRAGEFLSILRQTVWRWLEQVLPRLLGADPAGDIRNRIIQLAATCRSTFALELEEVSHLFGDPESVSIFVKCAIVLRDNAPGDLRTLPTYLRYLVESDMILSAEVVKVLAQSVRNNGKGLDKAIHYVWDVFRRDPAIPWRAIHDDHFWMACETSAKYDTDKVNHVHFNLLDGTVLLNGETLGKLPKDIVKHSLFQSVFPKQVGCNLLN